jgi:sulfite reductase alpha subunit-like flavoprotein
MQATTPVTAPIRTLLDAARARLPAFGQPYEGFISEQFGFLFVEPPLSALPDSHAQWDRIAASLPEALDAGQVRGLIDAMPLLPADADYLPAPYLCRAATILGIMAHAYEREISAARKSWLPQAGARAQLPDCLELPWEQVCKRLGRGQAAMTYNDLVIHNWRMRDPAAENPRDVENLEVLVPAFGNQEERIFFMTMVETHARSGSLIGAIARIEEAKLAHDLAALKTELRLVRQVLNYITSRTLLKIDPNPYSATKVDQLIWAKTVGPIASSTREGELGLSGAGAPVFHLLDALFQRDRHASQIGHETQAMFRWLPERHIAFIEATRRMALGDFVARCGEAELAGLYHGAFEAYAGKRGWLGVHRLKVYGFMELGFRVGRTETNGGFSGTVEALAWEALDDSLEQARSERQQEGAAIGCPFARGKQSRPATTVVAPRIHQVRLDLAGQGFVHEAGDRIGLLTQNNAELIAKTLAALQANGDEMVPLNSVWREAMRRQPGHGEVSALPLATFLAHAKIRPLLRPVGKALHTLTRSPRLRAILEAREEDQWELWDILKLLADENYDTRRLWKSQIWQAESIARLLPPEQFRVYSISSAPDIDGHGAVDLTVGALSYQSGGMERTGIASHFLSQPEAQPQAIPVELVRPSRFALPPDHRRPIVMFAAGTGFSPFRSFLQARAQQLGSGDNVLFFGTTTPADLPYRDELEAWTAQGKLHMHAAFSRQDVRLGFAAGRFTESTGQSGYVDMLMDEQAEQLWTLLQPQRSDGAGGYFYICGQTRFAHTVINAIKRIIARFLPQTTGTDDARVQDYYRQLVADGRLMFDIFTTFAPANAPGVLDYQTYDTSDIALRNNEVDGYWMTIQGNVYDLTEFRYLHPGGDRLLIANAGTDATRSYEKAEHHINPEVHALLDLYKIGRVRRLDFKDIWGIALAPAPAGRAPATATATQYGVIYMSLLDLYRHWVRYLFKVVECENAFNNNISLRRRSFSRADRGADLNRAKIDMLVDLHAVFMRDTVGMLMGNRLQYLWNATIGLCDSSASVNDLPAQIAAMEASAPALQAHRFHAELLAQLNNMPAATQDWTSFETKLEGMECAGSALLCELKQAVRKAVQVFEALEAATSRDGGQALIDTLAGLPMLLQAYYADEVHIS